jgi:hypothetical protein
VRFASRQAALLELMFASLHRPEPTHRCARPTTELSRPRSHSSQALEPTARLSPMILNAWKWRYSPRYKDSPG